MKVLTIKFDDGVDLTHLDVDDAVEVTKDGVAVSGSVMTSPFRMANPPEQELLPHTHPFSVSSEGIVGPAVPI